MTYLLDTCIISKLRTLSKKPDPILENWISKHQEKQYFLSVLTVGEIQKGISKLNDDVQRRILEDWLLGEVVPRFGKRILGIDTTVATCWGELVGSHLNAGLTLPSIDSLLAATAMSNNLILVTHNSKDFNKMKGLRFYNPWEVGGEGQEAS
jgi:predicted nucleic acid-binding protein